MEAVDSVESVVDEAHYLITARELRQTNPSQNQVHRIFVKVQIDPAPRSMDRFALSFNGDDMVVDTSTINSSVPHLDATTRLVGLNPLVGEMSKLENEIERISTSPYSSCASKSCSAFPRRCRPRMKVRLKQKGEYVLHVDSG